MIHPGWFRKIRVYHEPGVSNGEVLNDRIDPWWECPHNYIGVRKAIRRTIQKIQEVNFTGVPIVQNQLSRW